MADINKMISSSFINDEIKLNNDFNNNPDDENLKSTTIKYKTNSTNRSSNDVPNAHTSLKLHIRRYDSPVSSSSTTTTAAAVAATSQLNHSSDSTRRIISTRRTSLIESDLSHITDQDENLLRKPNGFKRKTVNEQQEKKRQKIKPIIQTRSSSRLKQKHHLKRSQSTEVTSVSTAEFACLTDDLSHGDYKYVYLNPTKHESFTNQCQTGYDIIDTSDQSIQTSLHKSDQSTFTDFVDPPVCEISTQTIQTFEQETQTQTNTTREQTHIDEQEREEEKLSSYLELNNDRLELFDSLIHKEEHPNGGASFIRAYYNEFTRLSEENIPLFVNYFFNLVYGEVNQRAKFAIGVLHDGARYLPDLVDYFSLTYPKMTVKTTNLLNSKEVLTTTMGEYRNHIVETYSNGTFRHGPLMSISLVGTVTGREECGDYFPTFLDKLEENPFLQCVMPWGTLSSQKMKSRTDSNDGPILWVRPGEQYVPTAEHKSCHPKKRMTNELRSLTYGGRGTDPREVLVEDRTKPHSDHCDSDGLETTAAVGLLKAVHVGTPYVFVCVLRKKELDKF